MNEISRIEILIILIFSLFGAYKISKRHLICCLLNTTICGITTKIYVY
jgi:hypothetical protein